MALAVTSPSCERVIGADLDVEEALASQGQGVGRELIRVTREEATEAKLILLAAPAAVDYYPHVGFTRHESAWTLDRLQ
ncbi:GNAT family N-acetyltransferase [Streptomyces sp. NPDC048723]|uniref:GNAT family N-acetyltransferase n=1 Tax=Streptomyces sp. NPDC048723 TaxID=3365589 RepID=UPI0037128D72